MQPAIADEFGVLHKVLHNPIRSEQLRRSRDVRRCDYAANDLIFPFRDVVLV